MALGRVAASDDSGMRPRNHRCRRRGRRSWEKGFSRCRGVFGGSTIRFHVRHVARRAQPSRRRARAPVSN